MRKIVLVVAVVFALALIVSPVTATGEQQSLRWVEPMCAWDDPDVLPDHNVTLPYTANIVIGDTAFLPAMTDNCTYQLIWHGDWLHDNPDWNYPRYEYPNESANCDDLSTGKYIDVDFDGMYEIWFNGNIVGDPQNNWTVCTVFFVDRDEMEQTRPLVAILIVFVILGFAWLLHAIAKSLGDQHAPMKLYLLFVQLFVAGLAIFSLDAVHREFLKTNTLSTTVNTMIYVFLIGIVTVTVLYFIVYLFKVLAEKMHYQKYHGPDYSGDEFEA